MNGYRAPVEIVTHPIRLLLFRDTLIASIANYSAIAFPACSQNPSTATMASVNLDLKKSKLWLFGYVALCLNYSQVD